MAATPFDHTTTADEVIEGIDLHGRTAVVTGATTGLGAETARVLAGAGAAVVLTARDLRAAADVIQDIRATVPDADLTVIALDLADPASITSAAENIARQRLALDLLINNAGVMYPPLLRTAQGFELQFGTNHLGHFLLTTLLLPALTAAADHAGRPSRVVSLSSDAHRAHPIDLTDPNFHHRDYDKFAAYGQSKTANILMTTALQHRHGDTGIHAYAVHPGVCATGLARHMTRSDFTEMKRLAAQRDPKLLTNLKSIPAAAASTIWAATFPQLPGGAYVADCAIGQAESHAVDLDTAAALWNLSTTLVR
ncbi:SDR family NAD(P)-dependent oxidoreductase [Nocardia sp. NPDC059240]|uniref:SDR family NAD(P)-dependent oxidoreductase n=1 Tax=Nocardia sp. NPDC059240 TaxID=3346786 RepID=UPI00368FB489